MKIDSIANQIIKLNHCGNELNTIGGTYIEGKEDNSDFSDDKKMKLKDSDLKTPQKKTKQKRKSPPKSNTKKTKLH